MEDRNEKESFHFITRHCIINTKCPQKAVKNEWKMFSLPFCLFGTRWFIKQIWKWQCRINHLGLEEGTQEQMSISCRQFMSLFKCLSRKMKDKNRMGDDRWPIENWRKRNLCGNRVGAHDRCVYLLPPKKKMTSTYYCFPWLPSGNYRVSQQPDFLNNKP